MLDATKCEELGLAECGREKCVPEKQIVNKKKNYYLFHYVTNGKGYAEIDGKSYTLKRGDIFYIEANTSAFYRPDKEKPWTYIWVGFTGLSAKEILKKCGITSQNPIFHDNHEEELKEEFYNIYSHYNQTGRLDFACLGYFYVLVNKMAERMEEKLESSEESAKSRHIAEACEYIANNFQFHITVQDIASSIGLSSNYLANIFSEKLSCSPKQYLTKYRMEKACFYLRSDDYSVGKVATSVGYGNQLHFSAEFKKAMGMSPLNYRKQIQVNEKK